MKRMINMSTSSDDVNRFTSREDLLAFIRGFDGLELMCFEDDERNLIPQDRVIGLHMSFYHHWVDFWNGNVREVLREYTSYDQIRETYGGLNRQAMVTHFQKDLLNALRYNVEYVVFHVSDSTIRESFTWNYHLTDDEVITAACEVLNAVFSDVDPQTGPYLLLENLWQPGLTFIKPEIPIRLLENINYPRIGFMLDTGHLLHTEINLETQDEGVAYINKILDRQTQCVREHILGIHLNQSITGAYSRSMFDNPPAQGIAYDELFYAMFEHVYRVDKHLPFTCDGVRELVERVNPRWLTYEFVTDCKETHCSYLAAQDTALGL